MVPTLQDGDRLIVVSGWLCGDYKYGDIVIAYKESFDAEPIVKRVIATEGQTVDIPAPRPPASAPIRRSRARRRAR